MRGPDRKAFRHWPMLGIEHGAKQPTFSVKMGRHGNSKLAWAYGLTAEKHCCRGRVLRSSSHILMVFLCRGCDVEKRTRPSWSWHSGRVHSVSWRVFEILPSPVVERDRDTLLLGHVHRTSWRQPAFSTAAHRQPQLDIRRKLLPTCAGPFQPTGGTAIIICRSSSSKLDSFLPLGMAT